MMLLSGYVEAFDLDGVLCSVVEVGKFDVKGYVLGFGNPEWKRTHEEALVCRCKPRLFSSSG